MDNVNSKMLNVMSKVQRYGTGKPLLMKSNLSLQIYLQSLMKARANLAKSDLFSVFG